MFSLSHKHGQSMDMISSAFCSSLPLHKHGTVCRHGKFSLPYSLTSLHKHGTVWTWSVQTFGPALPHYINMGQSVDMVNSAFWSCLSSLYKHGTVCGHGQFSLLALPPSLCKHGTVCGHGQFSLLVLPTFIT